MFVEDQLLRESFAINQFHSWPRPLAWWQYGLIASFACSVGSMCVLVFG